MSTDRRPLRVVQVGFHADPMRRDAESLLRAWPTLSSVASSVARAGVDVTVVQAAHADETLERDGVRYHFVKDLQRVPRRLIARVCASSPDVVHVHGLQRGLGVWRLSRALSRIPVLVRDHGSQPPVGVRRRAWQLAFRSVAGAVFTSRDQVAPWIDAGILRRDVPVFEALEGSTTFTPGDQLEARARTGMHGDPCVLWTGRLDANKNPFMMLEAFERAASALPDARLWCCFGAAPLLEQVRARIASSDVLGARVTLLGTRPHDEMELRHRAADLYVQTSHRESTGYALIEALACGTTPVVTDIPAARRIVGDAGALVPVGDADAFARALVDYARRDRTALRRAARARFEQSLTLDGIGRDLRFAYETVASSR